MIVNRKPSYNETVPSSQTQYDSHGPCVTAFAESIKILKLFNLSVSLSLSFVSLL